MQPTVGYGDAVSRPSHETVPRRDDKCFRQKNDHGSGSPLAALRLYNFSFLDIFALDRRFEAFQIEMPRLLCQRLDGAEMSHVEDVGAG